VAVVTAGRREWSADLATLWGYDIAREYLAQSKGADEVTAELLYEEIHARELARPRPGPQGVIGGLS
jgi:hypothetical protein